MCRSSSQGGRRCSGNSSRARTRALNTAHKRVERARNAVTAAQAKGDNDMTDAAEQRLAAALQRLEHARAAHPAPDSAGEVAGCAETTQDHGGRRDVVGDNNIVVGTVHGPVNTGPGPHYNLPSDHAHHHGQDDTAGQSGGHDTTPVTGDHVGDVVGNGNVVFTGTRGPVNLGGGPQFNGPAHHPIPSHAQAEAGRRAAERAQQAVERAERARLRAERAARHAGDTTRHGGIGDVAGNGNIVFGGTTGPVNLGGGAQYNAHTTNQGTWAYDPPKRPDRDDDQPRNVSIGNVTGEGNRVIVGATGPLNLGSGHQYNYAADGTPEPQDDATTEDTGTVHNRPRHAEIWVDGRRIQ